jgi:hypothetical protein
MLPRLWNELRASGSVVRVQPAGLPFSCALRLIPDRKDPTLARVIFPVCPLNDACVPPPRTPTPHLHALIATVVGSRWLFTADLRGWFFSLAVPAAVAAEYFAVRYGGEWYGCVRGLLGWKWMPYLMATVAHHLLCDAVEVGGGTALTWIDNVIGVFGESSACATGLERLRRSCGEVGASLHEVTAPSQRGVVVGLEFDLVRSRWKLAERWARSWVAAAAVTDSARSLPLRQVWTLVGGGVWVAFAAMLPLSWIGGALQYVSVLAGRWQRGCIGLDALVAYPRRVRDTVRAVGTYLCANPWRSLCARVSRPVFSDACGAGGMGCVIPRGRGYAVVCDYLANPPHINVLEARAARLALTLSSPPERASAVPVVVDNTTTAWQWRRGRGRPDAADAEFRAAYEWAAMHGVAIAPYIVPSAEQPADGASRALRRSLSLIDFPADEHFARAVPVGIPVWASARIPPGWRVAVSAAEFSAARARLAISASSVS